MYKTRSIRFIKTINELGWRLKVYSISELREIIDESYVENLKQVLVHLPQPSINDKRYGVGFVIIHECREMEYIVLSWWTGKNMLASKVYIRNNDESEYQPIEDHIIGCIWELEVIHFEKQRWTEAILKSELTLNNINLYLTQNFSCDL